MGKRTIIIILTLLLEVGLSSLQMGNHLMEVEVDILANL
jgi:uncharacterized membrane-anchored protein YitT (DUF2179 family)